MGTRQKTLSEKREEQQKYVQLVQESGLTVGQTFDSGMDLYRFLGLPTESGSSKKAMDKILKTVIDFESTGGCGKKRNEIVVKEIYDNPQVLVDNRVNNGNAIYSNLIETILLAYMAKQRKHVYYFYVPELYRLTGMCNKRYYDISALERFKKKNPIISSHEINSFFTKSSALMRDCLKSALASMSKRSLIRYYKERIIVYQDENGNVSKDTVRVATEDEENIILDAQREVLRTNGFDNMFSAFIKMGSKKYFDAVKKLLYTRYGWTNYYDRYKIMTVSNNFMTEAFEMNIVKICRAELNEKIKNKLNEKALNDYTEQERMIKQKWQEYLDDKENRHGLYRDYDVFREHSGNLKIPDWYVEFQKILADYFITLLSKEEKDFVKVISTDEEYLKCLSDIDLL